MSEALSIPGAEVRSHRDTSSSRYHGRTAVVALLIGKWSTRHRNAAVRLLGCCSFNSWFGVSF